MTAMSTWGPPGKAFAGLESPNARRMLTESEGWAVTEDTGLGGRRVGHGRAVPNPGHASAHREIPPFHAHVRPPLASARRSRALRAFRTDPSAWRIRGRRHRR